MANVVTFSRYDKGEQNTILKSKEKLELFEAINPKKFLQKVYRLDITTFADDNEFFKDVVLQCVDLFLIEFEITDFYKKTENMTNTQKTFTLFDEIMIDENIVDKREDLDYKYGKIVKKASKAISMNYECLMADLATEKQECLQILNTCPERTMLDFYTNKLINTSNRIDVLIDAYNQSREVLFVNKPSLFERISSPKTKTTEEEAEPSTLEN